VSETSLALKSIGQAAGEGSYSVGRGWYMVFALTVLSMLAYVDRMVLSLLVEPIKAHLVLSDTQMSLLLGASFAVFNTILTIGMGALVDRGNRSVLVGITAVLWSLATMACGLANSFAQLFVSRAGVGGTEGAIGPASFSMIRDGVGPERRGRAFAVLALSQAFGGAIALLGGGALLGIYTKAGPQTLPIVGTLQPWQMVLMTFGAIGMPLAALMLGVREPPRTHAESQVQGYLEALRYVLRHSRVYVPLLAFTCFYFMMTAAFAAWMPAVIGRNFGLTPPQIGVRLGPLLIVAPTLGMIVAGTAIDVLRKRGRANGATLVGLVSTIAVAPSAVLYPLADTLGGLWLLAGLTLFLSAGAFPVGQTLLSRITPAALTGKIGALYFLIYLLIGVGLGPLLVGTSSDYIFSGDRALAHAVSMWALVFLVCSLVSMFILMRNLRGFEAPEDHAEQLVPLHSRANAAATPLHRGPR
jgi:MFS family permease